MSQPDNDQASNPMHQHPLERGAVIQLCAGMPQVATRELSGEEHDDLLLLEAAFLRRSLVHAAVTLALLGIVSAAAFALFQWMDASAWYGLVLPVVSIILLLAGLTALFLPLDLLVRRSVLHRARRAGYVRVFEGTVNTEDFTDKTRRWLEKTGLLHDDADAPNTIELYAKHNVVHRINGEEPEEWLSVILTKAAAVPEDPLVLDVPGDWFPDAADGAMQRRRLTATEHAEILVYAEAGRKRLNLIPLMWGVPVFVALVFLMNKLLQLDTALGSWASAAIAAAITGYNVVHTRRKVRALLEDAEFGWIIILRPGMLPESAGKGLRDSGATTEFLPASETLWSFAGRPAAWRYGAALLPRS